MRLNIFLIVILLLGHVKISAQAHIIGSPTISNFSRSDYHAGTQNWMIKQDDRGLMYFGNNKGLLQFDGRDWQVFELPNETIVRSFAFDRDGKLYVGGQDELGYLEATASGEYVFNSLNHLIPDEIGSYDDVWEIFIRGDDVIFCSERAVFLLRAGEVKIFSPVTRFENFFETGDKIYIQDRTSGLLSLAEDQLQPVRQGEQFVDDRIIAILEHNPTQSLIVMQSRGMFLMDENGISEWKTSSSDFLTEYQPYCATKLTDGRYAIGTSLNGLLIMDREGNPTLHLNKDKGLGNNTILSVCEDFQQNLWLGLDNGISYAEINSPFSIIGSELGVEGTGYSSIIHDGKLYLGTNQGLLFTEWNDNSNPMDLRNFRPIENAIGQVWSITRLGKDVIIGQHKGASYLTKKGTVPFSTIPGAWKFMELDRQKGYAVEGTYTGLNLFHKVSEDRDGHGNWQFLRKLEGFSESARVMEQDSDGNIWVSHPYKGLYKLKLSDDLQTIQQITFYNSEQGLPTDLFINVATIRNELVFTTPNGVFKYEKEKGRFIEHEEFNRVFSDHQVIHRLIEDETGNVWFSADSDFGVLRVDEEGIFNNLELVYFRQIHEKLVGGFEQVYAHDDSNVFIATVSGFIHYDPERYSEDQIPFKVLIRKVISITDQDSTIYGGNATDKSTQEDRAFHYKMNDFRFAFSAPYYQQMEQLQYRYRLNGFDDTWSDWTSKSEKEYTNLSKGDYTFVVQARNASRQKSNEETFSFSILSPWYLSALAKICYVLLGCFALFSLVQFISKKEAKKRALLEIEQAREIEKKDAEFKKEADRSAGEIIQLRNDKLTADISHKNNQLAAATMHLVQKSEVLAKIQNELKNLLKDASEANRRKIQQISRRIESDIQLDDNWEQFEFHFDQVHENFFKRLRGQFPGLTPKDQKLCAYLRMNLTTKEIAPLLNISVRGVEIGRYRLRKKLQLEQDVNLVAFVMGI